MVTLCAALFLTSPQTSALRRALRHGFVAQSPAWSGWRLALHRFRTISFKTRPVEGPLLGCLAQRDSDCVHRTDGFRPSVLREDPRTPRGPRPPRAPDRELRLAPRQRALAGPGRRGEGRGPGRRPRPLGTGGDLRGDLPDRGLQRLHVAVVP